MNICGRLYVKKTYTDGHIRPHLGLQAEMVVLVTLTVLMLHNGMLIVRLLECAALSVG